MLIIKEELYEIIKELLIIIDNIIFNIDITYKNKIILIEIEKLYNIIKNIYLRILTNYF